MMKKDDSTIPIIYDTDMELDCDDAGALAVLHALMDFDEAEILGVIVDVPSKASAGCVSIINNYYNRSEIPVGILEISESEKKKNIKCIEWLKSNLEKLETIT